ncbi:MAG: class I SAM-dependent methyltransferase [Candidatus Babeliales bacterium]|jgi:23S rRNA (cytosine1962-C5)-methyltransferase
MKILTANFDDQYQLIDSGNGYKLEHFGNNIVARPDTNCVWKRQKPETEWLKANAIFKASFSNPGWEFKNSFKEPWIISYNKLKTEGICKNPIKIQLRATISKNLGIFPEQSAHWLWFSKLIAGAKQQPNVLNLFAYTGAATLCAAAAGAKVCHVDAAKSAVTWANKNQEMSGLQDAPIRWIVDDCTKFVMREIKRGVKYDGIIMDPPAFGRDQKGKVFEFEKQICNLLELCKQLLSSEPLFFIFNGYSMGYSSTVLKNLVQDYFKTQKSNRIEFGELQISEIGQDRNLPCSLYARF